MILELNIMNFNNNYNNFIQMFQNVSAYSLKSSYIIRPLNLIRRQNASMAEVLSLWNMIEVCLLFALFIME